MLMVILHAWKVIINFQELWIRVFVCSAVKFVEFSRMCVDLC